MRGLGGYREGGPRMMAASSFRGNRHTSARLAVLFMQQSIGTRVTAGDRRRTPRANDINTGR